VEHAEDMPVVPEPESLRSEAELRAEYADKVPERLRQQMLTPRPIELRPVESRHWMAAPARATLAHVDARGGSAAR
jgi:acyl-CoA thioesterase-2